MEYSFHNFSPKANEALNHAIKSAGALGHTFVGSEHLLLGLLHVENSVAASLLNSKGITYEKIENLMREKIGAGTPTRLSFDYFTPRAKHILEVAIAGCNSLGKKYVGTEHILFSLLNETDNYAVRYLAECGVDLHSLTNETLDYSGGNFETQKDKTPNSRGASNTKTPTLDKFGRDLTAAARKGEIDPVIGRNEEILRVIQILCRRTKNNPCLIGEPGVGKTAVVEGLAQRIADGDVPEILADKRLLTLDLTGMVAGTKYRGDFEERIKSIIDEVSNSKNIILFIDEVHTIIGAGSAEGSTDAANILKPSLARGEFQLIGATTIAEYRKNIEKDSALERRFQPVTVSEPSEEDAILILKGLKDKYEAHHKVHITEEAIEAAVRLSSRYINDRYLPDKAIDLIDEAGSKVRLKAAEPSPKMKELEEEIHKIEAEKEESVSRQDFEKAASLRDHESNLRKELKELKQGNNDRLGFQGEVTAEDIATIVSSWTGVPVVQLTEEESQRLLRLESVLHERLVGQNEAVTAVAKAIRRGRVGLKDPKRPIGSFLFLGPTGVGKTELCKALAEAMFGNENRMIRLDMSEYMEKHTVSRLVGSPPGYVGYEEGGQLTEQVRRYPYSVVLFDEIEKAHPDVFNILLQILEDGVLTDSQGRRVDFKNTVIIMTSNLGARYITEKKVSFGFSTGDQAEKDNATLRDHIMEELKQAFRPEFLNRIDDIIIFRKLNQSEIKDIAARMLNNLKKRVENLNITVDFDDSVIEKMSQKGFDPVYGARPLRREIQNSVEDLLSEQILDGSVKNGDHVLCTMQEDAIVFQQVN
ncbi:MAG: ATP-dependent Clp protease ATP-binding subunit [Clostridia bacterium]|nr:ATP-dependent Clp protease ATP-binding subunit [Clostridia bacterium]